METAMSAVWDLCIEPRMFELSDEERELMGVIGLTLKEIARKARCYEKIQASAVSEHGMPLSGNPDDFDFYTDEEDNPSEESRWINN
jgi:hypothetical protein